MNRFKSWLYCTTILLSLTSTFAERWSRQVPAHGFLAHQVNDWIPVQSSQFTGDRTSRFAQFPTSSNAFGVSSFAAPAQAQYNPFTTSQKFGFGAPQAQPLLQQQQSQVLTPQQLQSVEGGVPTGQEAPVELLYVPLETLQKQGFQGGNQNRYSVVPPNVNAALINNFYESGTVEPVSKSRFAQPITTTTSRPVTERHNPFHSSSTVTKATLKPYQPPLAMFLLSEGNNRASINDVLSVLKSANTIDVLDSPSDKRPTVFIGPSDMTPPAGYSKFELPYLSHLDSQRTGRKIENLPFFVAPLSYHTPEGFGKIPLPAPHVGSVVVNTPLSNKHEDGQYFGQNQLHQGSQSSKFGFNSQDKFNTPQFVSSTVAPSAGNRFNSNHFGASSTAGPSSTGRPVTSRPSTTFNDLREEHFNTEKQRVPVNRHPQQQSFNQFSSSQPTKQRHQPTSRPTQYHEEVTETPLPETQFVSFEASTTPKPTHHRRPTSAQTAQSSISYQTAPNRQPSSHSQFFEESFGQSPSTTSRPSTSFFSGFASQNPFSDQQFVHKFKLVDSVKPSIGSKDDFFNSFNNNPFPGFGNGYSTIKAFSPPPAPAQQTFKQQQQSFPSSTARPTNKRPTPSSTTFQFTPSSVRPVNEEIDVTTVEPVSSFSPTSSVFQSTFDFNGQSPANIHQQNILETTKLSYDPYKVPSTEKSVPVRNGNSNYRQQSSKAPLPSTDAPQNFAFQSSRRPQQQQPAFNDATFVNRFNNQQFASRPSSSSTTDDFTSTSFGHPTQSRPTKTHEQPQSTFFSSEDFTSTRTRPSTTARPQSQATRTQQHHRGSHNRGTRPTNIVTEGNYFRDEQEQFSRRPTERPSSPSPRPTTTTTVRPQELSYEVTGAPEVNVENNNVHEVQKDHIQLISHQNSVSEPNLYENPSEAPVLSTDAPTYNTPNDLPAISPMLPGLINSLTDDKWMEQKEEVTTTTTTTTRPFIRGRRPLPGRNRDAASSTTRSQSSSSEVQTSTRTGGTRARRPLTTTRFNKTSTAAETTGSSASSSSLPSTTASRAQAVRNNRVRYNPTNEERQRLRSRVRPSVSSKPVASEKDESIDYQRDVLNQNYPSIKPRVTQAPVTTTFVPSTTTTTEIPTRETEVEQENAVLTAQEVYQQENVPSNHATNYRGEQEHVVDPTRKYPGLFNGLQEEMILPEEHRTTLYEEQEIATEPVFDQRKSIFKQKARLNPVFTTARPSSRLTTTTESPSVETTTVAGGRRRAQFPRRQRPTTTQQPTTEGNGDEPTAKPIRHQPARGGLRLRERRPLNGETTTTLAPPTEVSSRRSFQSRGQQNDVAEEGSVTSRRQNFPSRANADRELKRPVVNDPTLSARGRQRSRFRLEQQESQWSIPSRVTDQDSSQENDLIDENEPELVTDVPSTEKEDNSVVGESEPSEERKVVKIFKRRRPETTTEAEVSEDAKETETAEGEKKTDLLKKGNAKRRGYWKKVRVRPVDTFETAESQHIGKHYLNTLIPGQQNLNKFNNFDKSTPVEKTPVAQEEVTATTIAPEVTEQEVKELNKDDAVHNNSEEEVTTIVPVAPEEKEEIITTIAPETVSVTEDDSSMFDEVLKSVKDLFRMTDEEEAEAQAALAATTIQPETEEIAVTTTIPQEEVVAETTITPTVEAVETSEKSKSPSDPMGSLVLATSTSQHVSEETEICYRGRCIKTDKKFEKK
ncbi:mucin-12 [Culicoides brevitarsis]|uniref:mucin-12 n=1 Tax=Culicoides brevitarsis TaxID=469753 RepID=UPI00307C74BA